MSVSTEKVTLQVTFPKEKLEALRFYMNEKDIRLYENTRIFQCGCFSLSFQYDLPFSITWFDWL